MKKNSVSQHLFIDYYSATPKHLQLANSIIKAIGDGKIKKDEILPSINVLSMMSKHLPLLLSTHER